MEEKNQKPKQNFSDTLAKLEAAGFKQSSKNRCHINAFIKEAKERTMEKKKKPE